MAKKEPFESFPSRYEEWFERHPWAYRSELQAVRELLPAGRGLEVGVGSGRFAAPLGVKVGVDPSLRMGIRARRRGVEVVGGVAEALPFKGESFDFLLLVTTICFLDDPLKAAEESLRVLKEGGALVVGFVDRQSPLGRLYEGKKMGNPFYRVATFFSVPEVVELMERAGFGRFRFCQTLFGDLEGMEGPDPVKEGWGEGGFVVVRGEKLKNVVL